MTSGKVQVSFPNAPHSVAQPATSHVLVLLALGEAGTVGLTSETSKRGSEKSTGLREGICPGWQRQMSESTQGRRLVGAMALPDGVVMRRKDPRKEWGKPTCGIQMTCPPTAPAAAPASSPHSPKEEGGRTSTAPRGAAHREFLRNGLLCDIDLWAALSGEGLLKVHASPLWDPRPFRCYPRRP